MSRWSVVVPTCRPESFEEFYDAWQDIFHRHSVNLIVVEDSDKAREEERRPWFIPQGTDMVRSWGIYKAWLNHSEFTLSLDDDVRPLSGVDIFEEYELVFDKGLPFSSYLDVGALTTSGLQMRGFPYRDRARNEVALQYGGWHGVLDYDAPTQLANPRTYQRFLPVVLPVPNGTAVTGCIMNAAWRTKYAPIMWQLPLLDGKYNRFGDIWSCLFAKRTFDLHEKVVAINGLASISHERASNVYANLERELPGIPINERLWEYAGGFYHKTRANRIVQTYKDVTTDAAMAFPAVYRENFKEAREDWLGLFS